MESTLLSRSPIERMMMTSVERFFRDLCAKFILRFNFMVQSMKFYRWPCEQEGSLYYQPNQCIVVREIPENYQKYVLLDSLKMGNLMTHEQTRCQNRPKKITAKDQEGFKFLHSMILGGATVAQVDVHVVGTSTHIMAYPNCSTRLCCYTASCT